jgi:hypothetical protein
MDVRSENVFDFEGRIFRIGISMEKEAGKKEWGKKGRRDGVGRKLARKLFEKLGARKKEGRIGES